MTSNCKNSFSLNRACNIPLARSWKYISITIILKLVDDCDMSPCDLKDTYDFWSLMWSSTSGHNQQIVRGSMNEAYSFKFQIGALATWL